MYNFIFVDDEDCIRELFEEIMDYKQFGFCLKKTFATATQAIAYVEQGNGIDVVITDIKMGNMSGIELCEHIHMAMPNVEMVVISGYKEFEYAQKAIKCNVFDYLLKPTSYADLERLFLELKAHFDEKSKDLIPSATKKQEQYHYVNYIETIKEYIDKEYAQDVSLEEMAHLVSMNASYLSRFFKLQTGVGFLEYLSSVRINKSIELLMDPTYKVYEVGQMVGYKSIKHFYKVFKNHTGVTPSDYRVQQSKGEPE